MTMIAKNIEKQLNPREKEVLKLIGNGYQNIAIAGKLCINVKTVEFHKENIKSTLGIASVKGLYHLDTYNQVL